jgi:ribosomal protein L11 methyltransferase
MKPNGIFISSGILYTKKADVVQAVTEAKDLELVDVLQDGDWVSVVARRK